MSARAPANWLREPPETAACPLRIARWADPEFVSEMERRQWQHFLDRLTGKDRE